MFDLMSSVNRLGVFFRVIGLGNTKRVDKSSRKCIGNSSLWFVVKLLVVFVDVVLLVKYRNCIYFYQDTMGAVNDLIKYGATVLSTVLILFESHVKADKLCHLTELAAEFQREILSFVQPRELIQHNRRFWRNYKIQIVIYSSVYLIFEIVVFPLYMSSSTYKYSLGLLIGSNIFIVICRYRHWQHVFYMKLVHHEVELLVKVVSDGRAWSGETLQQLKAIYGIPVEMVKLQNDYFGLSQAMNLIFAHLQLLGDAYWIYWRILNGGYSVFSYRTIIGFFLTIWLVVLLCSSSIKSTSLVPYFTYWLHRIERTNGVTSLVIQNFSTEILHGNMEYSAYGLFTINYAALIGISLSIYKFVIVFAQFASQNTNAEYLGINRDPPVNQSVGFGDN